MTLEEVRKEIDAIDSQMKPLFLKRMECSRHVAEAKAKTGGDVFSKAREDEIINKRAADVNAEVREEYVAFLQHLMSVSRRYQYGILMGMQDHVLEEVLRTAGLDAREEHHQVEVAFRCKRTVGNVNLFLNMANLNKIDICHMNFETIDDEQTVTMTLCGNVRESNMKRLICQMVKEAEDFRILRLK